MMDGDDGCRRWVSERRGIQNHVKKHVIIYTSGTPPTCRRTDASPSAARLVSEDRRKDVCCVNPKVRKSRPQP